MGCGLFVAEVFLGNEVVGHVFFDGFIEWCGRIFVSGVAEFSDVGAGVVLVCGAEVLGHVDVGDVDGVAEGLEDRGHEFFPGVGVAGAEVVEAGGGGGFGEVEGHGDGVFDVEEVATLFAVGVLGVVAFEEVYFALRVDLLKGFGDDAAHVPFVVFVGAEDVEVFEADDVGEPSSALRVEVKALFCVGVEVERA